MARLVAIRPEKQSSGGCQRCYGSHIKTALLFYWKNKMKKHFSIIDGERIFKATNVRQIHPVYLELSKSLATIEILKYIKIYDGRLCASNFLSENKKKEPVVKVGEENIVGVELLIDVSNKTIQFYSITSSIRGYGQKIVSAIVSATPKDWFLCVVLDWSGGFWDKMTKEYPQIKIL
jgi:hypothetical protein